MDKAIEESQKALEKGEVPIGAVIVYENRIIGRGHNLVETLQDATAHAEILAITSASEYFHNWRLENTTLFVTVEPCIMCLGAILNSRIKNLVYAVSEPKFGAFTCFFIKPNKLLIINGIMENKASSLLKNFFTSIRRSHL